MGAQYQTEAFDGSLTMRAEAFASSRVYFSEFNDEANSQRPYWLANANIRYDATDDWYASLYLNNIFDKTIVAGTVVFTPLRSEEHTSELQSLMRISYAVFCLKKKKINHIKYSLTS